MGIQLSRALRGLFKLQAFVHSLHQLSLPVAPAFGTPSIAFPEARRVLDLIEVVLGVDITRSNAIHRRVQIYSIRDRYHCDVYYLHQASLGLELPSMSNEIVQPTEQDLSRSTSTEGGKASKP